jgi:DNA-binding MarR family transcriptional regulator
MVAADLTEAARALNLGAARLVRAMRLLDRDAGLSSARLSALSVVVFAGSCTLGELARAEEVSGPTMTRIVDGLENDGLVLRQGHPDDGRVVRVSATGKGTALMHAAADRRADSIAVAVLDLPEQQRRALLAAAPALTSVAAAIRAAADRAHPPAPRVR